MQTRATGWGEILRFWTRVLLGGMAILIAGCGPQPSPTPTASPTTSEPALPPTPSPAPPQATDTLSPPTPEATVAAVPSPTPTAPQATETPVPQPEGERVGAQVSPEQAEALCAQLRENGAAATGLWVRWGEVDLGNGEYDWAELDRQVDALRACGLEVGIHVQARQRRLEISAMPTNLEAYTRFLTDLVTHLKGRVKRYAIENEAVSAYTWADSQENYFKLLDLGYETIKAADPEAIVVESALSGTALGVLRAYSLYEAGQRQAAQDLVLETVRDTGGELALPREPTLDAFFANPKVARVMSWMPMLVEHQDSFDAFQLHWYGPWQRLPDLIDWIRAEGISKPIEAWELGKHYHNPAEFDEAQYAQIPVKLLVTAAGEGARFIVFFPYMARPERDHPGLMTRQGPRPANGAFRVVAQNLNGFQAAERLDLGPSVWAYRFTRPQGDLYVLWTDEGQVTVRLPIESATVTVTDIWDETSTADPTSLDIGSSPVFVTP